MADKEQNPQTNSHILLLTIILKDVVSDIITLAFYINENEPIKVFHSFQLKKNLKYYIFTSTITNMYLMESFTLIFTDFQTSEQCEISHTY